MWRKTSLLPLCFFAILSWLHLMQIRAWTRQSISQSMDPSIHQSINLSNFIYRELTLNSYITNKSVSRLIMVIEQSRVQFYIEKQLGIICTREQIGPFCNFHEWLPQPWLKIRISPICSQLKLIPNCFEKKDRFPFSNTGTVNMEASIWRLFVIKCC